MISPLHQFSLTQLIIGALFIVVLLAAVQHWALRRLNAEPGDEMENASGDKASEILGDAPVRSKVGTPRPRRLQPLRAGEEEPVSASTRPGAAVEVPADSLAMAGVSAQAKPTENKPVEPAAKPTILPPLVTALGDLAVGGAKKPEPAATATDKPRETVALPPLAIGAPSAAKATNEPVPAVQPVSLAPATGAPQVAKAESDDVKKRKILPSVPVPDQKAGGSATGPKTGEAAAGTPPLTPAEPIKAVEPPPAPKPEAAPKTGDRPRIFLPANLPAAAKTGGEVAPVPAIPASPTPVEAKTTPPAVPVPAKPDATGAKPVEPVSAMTAPPKTEAKPEPSAVPVPPVKSGTPASVPQVKSETPALAPQEAAKITLPAAASVKEEKPPVPPLPVAQPPAPVPTVGAGVKAPAAGTPDVSVPPPLPILPKAAPKEVPVRTPQPTMAQNETTTDLPANSRASAQLTLGFEVTSLQLTPFFKLGGVQLKSLSKVASLHLIATQSADNPLAAGISFEIDNVELNESSHIRSILLKPFQGEEPAAVVPQSKLQVDAIQIAPGGEGAPISVTSSGQNSTTVQMLATFTIASMEFTPAFEIGSLRLEPTSNFVLLRLSPSARPAALDLPPSFEVANVQLSDGAQLASVRLTPGSKPA